MESNFVPIYLCDESPNGPMGDFGVAIEVLSRCEDQFSVNNFNLTLCFRYRRRLDRQLIAIHISIVWPHDLDTLYAICDRVAVDSYVDVYRRGMDEVSEILKGVRAKHV